MNWKIKRQISASLFEEQKILKTFFFNNII